MKWIYWRNNLKSVELDEVMVDSEPVGERVGRRGLHRIRIVAAVDIFECRPVEFVDWPLVSGKGLDFVDVIRVEILESLLVFWRVHVLFVVGICCFAHHLERVNWNRSFVNDVRSGSLHVGLVLPCVDHVATELPGRNLSQVLVEGVFHWFVRAGQLINVVPSWV